MLDALKFVQGSIAKKDLVPVLSHFRLENGFIRGFNGKVALCSPIAIDLQVSPKAQPFIKAIQACQETAALTITPTGRLSIKSGTFRAQIECTDEPFPDIQPTGQLIDVPEDFIRILRTVEPFIAEDASRPWATGVLFRGCSAFATNNIMLVEYWTGKPFPVDINIPHYTINELLRIKEQPVAIQVANQSISFHYEGDRWLRSSLLDLGWPDINPMLNQPGDLKALPDGFFDALVTIAPFLKEDNAVHLDSEGIRTSVAKEEAGAFVQLEGLPTSMFNHKHLTLLASIKNELIVSFENYPGACPFQSGMVRGVMMGMRQTA